MLRIISNIHQAMHQVSHTYARPERTGIIFASGAEDIAIRGSFRALRSRVWSQCDRIGRWTTRGMRAPGLLCNECNQHKGNDRAAATEARHEGAPLIARSMGALLIVAAAVGTRFAFGPDAGPQVFVILLIGMLASSWVGGMAPGIAAQTIILLIHWRFFAPPDEHAWPPPLRAYVNISAYYGVGMTVAVLSDFVRAARTRDRKSAAEALAQRERLHAVLSCVADGVIATDAAGKIVSVNPMAESLLGISANEASGKPLSDIFVICDASTQMQVADPASQALQKQGVVRSPGPLLLNTRTGARIPISFSAAPISEAASSLSGAVVVFRDESERRDAEEALRSADRRKDEFLATLAHELRNPLAPICMGLELMKLSEERNSGQNETRAMVERQARHMARLIDDLLDVSRISRGKLELRKSHVCLQTVVNNVVAASRGTIEKAGHKLSITLPTNPVVLDADPDRLMQILANLINNAAKYTPSGGRISLDAEVRNGELQLTVADNGRGIEAGQLATIFELFNQPRLAHEAGHSGLGIGLTLTKQLVELHGGAIEARSEGAGRGSAFLIRMPIVDAPADTPVAVASQTAPAGALSRKVLLADDNRDSLLTLSMLVASLGCEVHTANDGLEAIEAAESFQPQVILMDLGMPRMNGYDAAKEIRRRDWGKRVQLVAVTGWGQAADRERTKAAGFDGHLVKPIDMAALSQALAAAGHAKTPKKQSVLAAGSESTQPAATDMAMPADGQFESQVVE